MTNKEFLKKASRLQKEIKILKKEKKGLYGIDQNELFVSASLFHELEREKGLINHISKELVKERKTWFYSAMTHDGVKIISNESVLS